MGARRAKKRKPNRMRVWACGRVPLPGYLVREGEDPYRPDVILCVERPQGLVVGYEVTEPAGGKLREVVVVAAALQEPLVGPARRPDKIFVTDQELAQTLSEALGIKTQVGSVPELDHIAQAMFASTRQGDVGEDESYFGNGRVSTRALTQMFDAAAELYELQPWVNWVDSDLVDIDVPDLGIHNACISIIGALGDSLGLLIFPSRDAFGAFMRAAERGPIAEGPIDLGTSFLALNFERGAELPRAMRKEVAQHRWRIAGPMAYPWPQHRDSDGLLRPNSERDALVVTLCARAVVRLVKASNDDGELSEVTDTFHGHEVTARVAGSGEDPMGGRGDRELDAALIQAIRQYAEHRFGQRWLALHRIFAAPDDAQLAYPLSAYAFEVDDRPIVDWFVEDHGPELHAEVHSWLQAQQQSWLSLWEVVDVRPGEGLTLLDCLTGQHRDVEEVAASRSLRARDGLLGRVVDAGDHYIMSGVHPRVVGPRQLEEITQSARTYLRRRTLVPVQRLQSFKVVSALVKRWEQSLADTDARPNAIPTLCNTDGEPLLLTQDHFRYEADHAPQEIEARLASVDDIESPQPGDSRLYTLTRANPQAATGGNRTVLAHIRVESTRLTVETNSVARADAVRERLEGLLEGLVGHQLREHTDPTAAPVLHQASDRPPATPPTQEMQQVVKAYKAEHYRDWAQQPLPALQGKTARESVATKQGRRKVDQLLKEMEHLEAGLPLSERYDFSTLRRELGL